MAKVEPGMESMLEMYIFETNTLLEQLDEILLRTEDANVFSQDDINEIFRIMHTIKGSSAMMGFENLQHLAHKGEDMFFVIRESPKLQKTLILYMNSYSKYPTFTRPRSNIYRTRAMTTILRQTSQKHSRSLKMQQKSLRLWKTALCPPQKQPLLPLLPLPILMPEATLTEV